MASLKLMGAAMLFTIGAMPHFFFFSLQKEVKKRGRTVISVISRHNALNKS